MRGLTRERIDSELVKTQAVMYRLAGKRGTLFRPPYGEYDTALLAEVSRLGLRTITWEVVSGDPDPNVHAPDMIREVVRRVRPGSIVIMHVNGRGWHTAEALPAMISGLRTRGYHFVTVDEAIGR
jgi:peptidoglycan/xylan/chitin deacetylase (PgdA/CDA1 family)